MKIEFNKSLKKYILFFVCFLCATVFSFAESPEYAYWTSDELESDGFEKYSSTDELELYLNVERAIFAVRKISSGYVWYSSPINWEEDEFASGFNKNAIPSMIQLNTKDRAGSFYPANSYVNSVRRKGFRVLEEDGGFTLNHNFSRDGFFIPLHVTIEDNSLVVRIKFSEIEEAEDDPESTLSALSLVDITVLPYFGAAPQGEDGYIFVPDGSGSIIKFDNDRSQTSYKQYVYGRDESIIPSMKKTVTQDIYLPVFGMKREGAGFIAVIEDNRTNSVICAETAGQSTLFNNVNSNCIVRDLDTFTFRERTGSLRDIRIFETVDLTKSEKEYSIRYIFLDEEENSYVGMANAYRKYLQKKNEFPNLKTKKDFSMTLNFIGAGTKKKAVLGIPQKVDVPFTPFNSVSETIDTLKSKGIENFTVKYDGWIKGGIFGKYPSSPKPEGNLGGNNDFKDLLSYMKTNEIDFYAGADFVNLYETDFSHIKEITANREINKSPVKVPDFRPSTFDEKTTGDTFPNWILRLSSVKKGYDKFLKKFNQKYEGTGLAPDSLGNVVGSDFGKNGASRLETAEGFSSMLKETSLTNPILLSAPFDYALNSVSYITDAPSFSSSYEIEDYSVPFYQILIKGFIPFSNFPANRALNKEDYILNLLETGSDISYMWITQNQEELRDSRLQSYSSVLAQDWIDEAFEIYEEVSPILKNLNDKLIINHTVYENGARITEYEDGTKILTNYSDQKVTVENLTAEAHSYAVGGNR